jgi:hypothetical protein
VALAPLQVLVNGRVRAQVRPGASAVVKVTTSDDYLEVIGRDQKGSLLLAVVLLADFKEFFQLLNLQRLRIEWEAHSGAVSLLPVMTAPKSDNAASNGAASQLPPTVESAVWGMPADKPVP